MNEGVLEEECVFDFAHRESMRTVLSNATGEAQTDEDVDAVISAGSAYLRNLPLGRSGFSSRGRQLPACTCCGLSGADAARDEKASTSSRVMFRQHRGATPASLLFCALRDVRY